MDQNNIENNIIGIKKNEKEGLSPYSYELINNTRNIVTKLFPNEKEMKDQTILNKIAINKEIARICTIFILKDMNLEEKNKFIENPGDFKNVLSVSLIKAQLPEEIKNSIQERIDSITPEDFNTQRLIVEKLDLLNFNGDIRKMTKMLYESFKENSEVSEAYSYLNLTEK